MRVRYLSSRTATVRAIVASRADGGLMRKDGTLSGPLSRDASRRSWPLIATHLQHLHEVEPSQVISSSPQPHSFDVALPRPRSKTSANLRAKTWRCLASGLGDASLATLSHSFRVGGERKKLEPFDRSATPVTLGGIFDALHPSNLLRTLPVNFRGVKGSSLTIFADTRRRDSSMAIFTLEAPSGGMN